MKLNVHASQTMDSKHNASNDETNTANKQKIIAKIEPNDKWLQIRVLFLFFIRERIERFLLSVTNGTL